MPVFEIRVFRRRPVNVDVRAPTSRMMLIDPPNDLEAGPVRLRFDRVVEGDSACGLVPYYHFKVLDRTNTVVGHINLRIGDTTHVLMCAGHVGYEIIPEFRGQSYSYFACQALVPVIDVHYEQVIITVEIDNIASRRTIERLGAEFIDTVDVPADDPAYAGGARRKRRFAWCPNNCVNRSGESGGI